jgi:excisionase family DNA binding protein
VGKRASPYEEEFVMAKPAASGMIGVDELASELGVTVRYVRRVVAERRIRYVKVGHLVRFERQAIDSWIEANKVEAIVPGPRGVVTR